eukprot:CAMPEP_0204908574 /NCGR_PEP_ID=MMETSP1397-20131031/7501_1 /ASSEMBLY_ACC=CAM_ASM_000891 /TAXON_ID=49980 /ORGANISM="Climacostomum Climacostomum virens, Strain Stock W-24" /LENGTH=252 /DNA_ID=CAMNT_0052078147 /DNA_START=505 /DNA_END=1263 /DNA_ORIENTATION=+
MTNLKLFYIAISFVEELLFILSVWLCRNINDDFAMTFEMTIVCAIWFTNSFLMNWVTKISTWIITAAARNFAIMLVSSVWPLIRSFRTIEFGVPLTFEVLNNLELLLQNEATLEAFSQFLNSGKYYKPVTDLDMTVISSAGSEGYHLLDFWVNCEVYKYNPSPEKAAQLYNDFITSKRVYFNEELLSSMNTSLLEEKYIALQNYAFSVLQESYFPFFQRSVQYNLLLKEVNRQDIYLNRLTHTSFLVRGGAD